MSSHAVAAANLNSTVYGGQAVYVSQLNAPSTLEWRGTIHSVVKETSTGKLLGLTNNHVLGGYTSSTIDAISISQNQKRYFKQATAINAPANSCTTTATVGDNYGSSYKTLP